MAITFDYGRWAMSILVMWGILLCLFCCFSAIWYSRWYYSRPRPKWQQSLVACSILLALNIFGWGGLALWWWSVATVAK